MRRFARTWTVVADLALVRLVLASLVLAGLVLGAGAVGCKEDPMLRARAMHATEQADEAEAALDEVLAAKPGDFEARRLKADLPRFRGDFAGTEKALQALWDEKGFDDEEKEFLPEERAQKDLLENQFNELYAKWAASLDPAKDAELYEKVLTSGLKWKPKSPPLNRQLVDFYRARAEALAKKGDKLAAAQAYEKILQLRTMPQQREEAREKAASLREEAFTEAALARFESTVKPALVAAEQWDAEAGVIKLRVEAEVDRKLRDNESGLAAAREQAAPAIRAAVAAIVAQIGGLEPEQAAATPVKFDSGEEELRRGDYAVTVLLQPADVISGAFAVKEKARQAGEQAKQDAAQGAKAEEPAPAGDAAAGTTDTDAAGGATNGGGPQP